MSYLDTPRLVFTGHSQADVSTVNNGVRYFDNAAFQRQFQELSTTGDNSGWDPEGTAIFGFIGCRVTGIRLANQQVVSAAQDPIAPGSAARTRIEAFSYACSKLTAGPSYEFIDVLNK